MKWEKVKLSEVCSTILDGDHQSVPKSESGIHFIKISDIENNRITFNNVTFVSEEYYQNLVSGRKALEGDVLFSVVGTYGIPVFVNTNEKFCFERNLALLKANERINSKFLYYSLKNPIFYKKVDLIANGSAQKLIPLSKLKELVVSLPDENVQKRIVDILSSYDNLIENNQKQIKLLEEAAQRLYKEWFVDLRFPGYEDVEIIDGLPVGWERRKLSELCETVGGGTPSTKEASYYTNGKLLWVTPTDITKNNSIVLLDTEKKITEEGLKNSSAKMLPEETILMTSRASVGYFGICEYRVCTNQGFISCVPNHTDLQMYLLYNLMDRVEEIRQKAGGSTYLEISKKTFRDFDVVKPDVEVLKKFQEIEYNILKQIRVIAKKIVALQEARDRLLPKLMSGEVEV